LAESRNDPAPTGDLRRLAEGRYRDFEVIGRGGMGVVYLALDSEMSRRVAFKIVTPDPHAPKSSPVPEDPSRATPPAQTGSGRAESFDVLRKRFLQEAWVTGAMEHPGVVPVYELGETEAGIPFYTMRYVRGERTLADAIRDAKETETRLTLVETFLRVCDTIRYAHARGILHRDLKPENIALGEFGEVIVLDWGLAKSIGQPDQTAEVWRARLEEFKSASDLHTVAGALGTPGYMAPEAALGRSEEVDVTSDVYSLGAILYETLTGRLPHRFTTYAEYVRRLLEEEPESPSAIDPGVPYELASLCLRALARERHDRFPGVAELAAAVRRWQTHGTVERQVEALLADARMDLKAAERLSGNLLQARLDRATAACSRALHLRPDAPAALALMAELKRRREGGIRARLRGDRRRLLHAVGVALLAVTALATLVVAGLMAREQTRAEDRIRDAESAARLRLIESELAAAQRLQSASERLAASRAREREAAARFGGAYRETAHDLLTRGRIGLARVYAAHAAATDPSAESMLALAEAERRWCPTLTAVLPAAGATAVLLTGTTLFWADGAGVIREVDRATGSVRRELRGVSGQALRLIVTEDEARLFAAGSDGRVYGWELEGGTLLAALPERFENGGTVTPEAGTQVTCLLPYGRPEMLLAGYSDGKVRGWSLGDRKMVAFLRLRGGSPTALGTSGDGEGVRIGASDGRAYQVHVMSLVEFDASDAIGRVEAGVAGLSPSEDDEGLYLWTATHRVLHCTDGRIFTALKVEAPEPVAVELTADHRLFLSAGRDGVLRLWHVPEQRPLGEVDLAVGTVRAIALGDEGRSLAVAYADDCVRLFDLEGRCDDVLLPSLPLPGGALCVARPDHSIEVIPPRTDRKIVLRGHTARLTALASDAEGARLASASLDGTVRIWDAAKGEMIGQLQGLECAATALGLDANSDQIVLGNAAGVVEEWDYRRRSRVAPATATGSPICGLALSENGLHFYAAMMDGRIRHCRRGEAIGEHGHDASEPAVAIGITREGPLLILLPGGRLVAWSLQGGARDIAWPEPGTPPASLLADGTILAADGRLWEWEQQRGARPTGASARSGRPGAPWILVDATERIASTERLSGQRLSGLRPVALTTGSSAPSGDRGG